MEGGESGSRAEFDAESGAKLLSLTFLLSSTSSAWVTNGDMPAAAKNRHGAEAERGNVHILDLSRVPGFAAGPGEMLPYPTKTTAAGYYNSGVVAGEALPLASKVFVGRTKSVPAVAVRPDKVAGVFTERLRRGLPILGLSAASLAVTGLAAGEPTPAAAFGLFLMLIVGLSTVIIRALRD